MRATFAQIAAARRRLPENVRALGWVSLANDAASELSYPIVPLFLTLTLGAPVAAVGIVEGIAEAIATAGRLLSGWLSDRMGERRKPGIMQGYAASTISRALLAAAPAWGWVLGARVLDRVGKGVRSSPRDALIRDSTPKEMYGTSFGYHRAMDTIGAIVGPLTAAVLLWIGVSLRTILWVAFVLGLAVLFVLRRVREAPRTEMPAAVAAPEAKPRRASSLPAGFWAALAIWVAFSLGNSSDAFIVLRARDLGLGVILVVLAYAVYNVVYASSSWPLGALSDRIPRTLVIGGGLAVFFVVYLGLAVANASWLVWPLFALYGLYIAATEGVARAWVADHIHDRSAAGTAYGIFFSATAGAALIASVVAGVLWEYVSPRAPFYLGAAMAGLALVGLLMYSALAAVSARTAKVLLAGVGVGLVAAGIAAASNHRRVADAFQTEGEALPAGVVRACGPEPTERLVPKASVSRFPHPVDTVYTAQESAGPTTIMSGFFRGDVGEAKRAYEAIFPTSGYDVLRSEQDPADAEVNFSGANTTGQVKLTQECRSRTRVAITVRPA